MKSMRANSVKLVSSLTVGCAAMLVYAQPGVFQDYRCWPGPSCNFDPCPTDFGNCTLCSAPDQNYICDLHPPDQCHLDPPVDGGCGTVRNGQCSGSTCNWIASTTKCARERCH